MRSLQIPFLLSTSGGWARMISLPSSSVSFHPLSVHVHLFSRISSTVVSPVPKANLAFFRADSFGMTFFPDETSTPSCFLKVQIGDMKSKLYKYHTLLECCKLCLTY